MTEQTNAQRLADELDAVPENGADPDLISESSAELRRLDAENDQLRAELARIHSVGSCGTVDSWLSLSDDQKREWFATTLHRDSEQCKTIRALEAELEAVRRDADLEQALEALVNRCNNDACMSSTDEVIAAEAALERLYKSRHVKGGA